MSTRSFARQTADQWLKEPEETREGYGERARRNAAERHTPYHQQYLRQTAQREGAVVDSFSGNIPTSQSYASHDHYTTQRQPSQAVYTIRHPGYMGQGESNASRCQQLSFTPPSSSFGTQPPSHATYGYGVYPSTEPFQQHRTGGQGLTNQYPYTGYPALSTVDGDPFVASTTHTPSQALSQGQSLTNRTNSGGRGHRGLSEFEGTFSAMPEEFVQGSSEAAADAQWEAWVSSMSSEEMEELRTHMELFPRT
ncbi:hypothetical protein FA15DRAFT_704351 [Coprinopsis marcescibilis]|uniref:Uncharacterized protein n=1 Tax=Coprinopsis marcescibilis TaxID=230819 RepID=A0A5C3KXX4_COPMA|nr:hypothetical protein FA15DRAFT_704351 [Coprinopsis marcescibilis]